jgi:AcrR family transcriptional regulator
VNEKRPEQLLDAIVQYLTRHGIAEVSLRPLARAVGSSPRVLLYYFGSKEKMVIKVLAELRRRQRALYTGTQAPTLEQACRTVWKHISSPPSQPLFRLFFEAYGLALRHPRPYQDFLHSTIDDWLQFVAAPLRREGHSPRQARALATVILAALRGLMLDFCATGDRPRLDRAVNLWLPTLDCMLRNAGAKSREKRGG